jgi:hypothetical protein
VSSNFKMIQWRELFKLSVYYMHTCAEEHMCVHIHASIHHRLHRVLPPSTTLPKTTEAEIAGTTGFPSGGGSVDGWVCAWKVCAPQRRVRVESIGSADHWEGSCMERLEEEVLVSVVCAIRLSAMVEEALG